MIYKITQAQLELGLLGLNKKNIFFKKNLTILKNMNIFAIQINKTHKL